MVEGEGFTKAVETPKDAQGPAPSAAPDGRSQEITFEKKSLTSGKARGGAVADDVFRETIKKKKQGVKRPLESEGKKPYSPNFREPC